jgi:hypothetical protein
VARRREDRLLADERVYGRGDRLKVFISSEMRSGKLTEHRLAAVKAVEELPRHHAWHWERDGSIGSYSALPECVRHAGTSDVLILILGSDLTPTTHAEYEEAVAQGAVCCIFVLEGVRQKQEVKDFIKERQEDSSYRKFRTQSDLRTLVVKALLDAAFRDMRLQSVRRRSMVCTTPTSKHRAAIT